MGDSIVEVYVDGDFNVISFLFIKRNSKKNKCKFNKIIEIIGIQH